MATKIEQAKNALKKLKEKKAALDKQITLAEKKLLAAEAAEKKAKALAGSSVKKAVGKAASAKKAVASKLSSLKKK